MGKRTRELAKLGLSVRETNRFYELNEEIQGNLLKESAATGKRLLGIDFDRPGRGRQVLPLFPGRPIEDTRFAGRGFGQPFESGGGRKLVDGFLERGEYCGLPIRKASGRAARECLEYAGHGVGGKVQGYFAVLMLWRSCWLRVQGFSTKKPWRKGEVADLLLRDYRLGSTERRV